MPGLFLELIDIFVRPRIPLTETYRTHCIRVTVKPRSRLDDMLKRRFKHHRITKFMRSVSMQIEFVAGAFENPVIGERTQQFIMAGSWLVSTREYRFDRS